MLGEEAQQWIGCGMTYTLFECLKERVDELMAAQPAHNEVDEEEGDSDEDDDDDDDETGSDDSEDDSDVEIGKLSLGAKSKEKKEHLTKAQKRRKWDQSCVGGERPRGYDWVDIIKHLSQVGSKDEAGSVPQHYDG